MSEKYNLFRRMEDFNASPNSLPISKVMVNVDSDNYFAAGDDTGSKLEFYCPWGSQEMAENVLAGIKGYVYKPYEATRSLCDCRAELGDWANANGIYSVIAKREIEYDGGLNPVTIGAPAEKELESEYPYTPPEQRQSSRELARTRALITKTSEEIKLSVEGLEGKYAELKVTVDGVTIAGPDGSTVIDGGKIDATELHVSAANIDGTLTADQIDATNLKVSAANITGSLTIGQLPSNVATDSDIPQYTSDLINNSGYQTESGVTSIINGTVTTDYVNALGVYAATLKGNQIQLVTGYGSTSGIISLTSASSGNYAVDIESYAALRITAESGNIYMSTGGGSNWWSHLQINGTSDLRGITSQNVMPNANDSWYVGDYNRRYSGVYVTSGLITSSDRNLKHNIQDMPEKYLNMLYDLKPSIFQMNAGTSGRYHPGFIAQDVESAMVANDISDIEFAGLVIGGKDTKNPIYMLRYEEFIAIAVKAIQDLNKRVKTLEAV